ncbi:hypothetical protein [Rhodanobacter sp. BL-MT-08]
MWGKDRAERAALWIDERVNKPGHWTWLKIIPLAKRNGARLTLRAVVDNDWSMLDVQSAHDSA